MKLNNSWHNFKPIAQERKDSGEAPTTQDNQANIAQQAIDQGVDPAIFGDFSEKDLAAGIQKLVNSQVSTLVQQQLQTALAPIATTTAGQCRASPF